MDLSAPEGHRVNAGIPEELCFLCYPSLNSAMHLIALHGPSIMLSKLDIKEAYRMVPVDPQNRFLLGIRWNSRYYIDTRLPFGLCSAPKIFTAVTDDLESIFFQQGL